MRDLHGREAAKELSEFARTMASSRNSVRFFFLRSGHAPVPVNYNSENGPLPAGTTRYEVTVPPFGPHGRASIADRAFRKRCRIPLLYRGAGCGLFNVQRCALIVIPVVQELLVGFLGETPRNRTAGRSSRKFSRQSLKFTQTNISARFGAAVRAPSYSAVRAIAKMRGVRSASNFRESLPTARARPTVQAGTTNELH